MTNYDLQKLCDGLQANAAQLKTKGETAYANGLLDACRRLERFLPDTAAAPPPPPPAPPEPLPGPEDAVPKGVFSRLMGD